VATVRVAVAAASPRALVSVRLEGQVAYETNAAETIRVSSAVAFSRELDRDTSVYTWNVTLDGESSGLSTSLQVPSDARSLILPPGTLRDGAEYLVALTVRDRGSNAELGRGNLRVITLAKTSVAQLANCTAQPAAAAAQALVTRVNVTCLLLLPSPRSAADRTTGFAFSVLLAGESGSRWLRREAGEPSSWTGVLPPNATHVRVGVVAGRLGVVAHHDVPVTVETSEAQRADVGAFVDAVASSPAREPGETEDNRLVRIGFLADVLNDARARGDLSRRLDLFRRARLLNELGAIRARPGNARGVLESLRAVAHPLSSHDADAAHRVLASAAAVVVEGRLPERDVLLALRVLGSLVATARGDDARDAERFAETREVLEALLRAHRRGAVLDETAEVVTAGFVAAWRRTDGTASVSVSGEGARSARVPAAAFPAGGRFTAQTVDVEAPRGYDVTRVDFALQVSDYAWEGGGRGASSTASIRVTAGDEGLPVQVLDLDQPVRFSVPVVVCGGGGDAPAAPECHFFDVAEQRWSREGCRSSSLLASAEGSVQCECDHLTDFAVLRAASFAKGGGEGERLLGGPGYLALALVYAGVGAVATDKLFIVLRAQKCAMFVLASELALVTLTAALRASAMLVYFSGGTEQEEGLRFLSLLAGIAPLASSVMFTGIAYSWASALGAVAARKAAATRRGRKRECGSGKIFFGFANAVFVVATLATFVVFVATRDPLARRRAATTGAVVGVVGQFCVSVTFQIVGQRLVRALTMDFSSKHAKGILQVTRAFSACLLGSGLVNAVAVALDPEAFSAWADALNCLYTTFEVSSLGLVLHVFRRTVDDIEQSRKASTTGSVPRKRLKGTNRFARPKGSVPSSATSGAM
jgi:hypothetical protein